MSHSIKHSLIELLNVASQFNRNDILVDILRESAPVIDFHGQTEIELAHFPIKLLREMRKTLRESGVNPLCISVGSVELNLQGSAVETPILFVPAEVKIDKIRQRLTISYDDKNGFFNPFLKLLLNRDYNVDVPVQEMNLEEPNSVFSFLADIGLTLNKERSVIGNFHHRRYEIIRELEELIEGDHSENINQLLSGGSVEIQTDFPDDLLFPSDADQEAVFEIIQSNNSVIHGPPGTGKSQVLTNLIGKSLKQGKRSLVVSEKKAALDVVQKKLSEHDLDRFCFLATGNQPERQFIRQLEAVWNYLEGDEIKKTTGVYTSKQLEANLQLQLALLSQEELIGGVSFRSYLNMSKGVEFTGRYISNVPTISFLEEYASTIQTVFNEGLNKVIGTLKPHALQQDVLLKLDQKVVTWQKSITKLAREFDLVEVGDLERYMRWASICQIFENELYSKYANVFKPNSRPQKRFLKLRKEFLQLQLGEKSWNGHWKRPISNVELESFKNGFHASFFKKLRTKKLWKEVSSLPFEDALTACKEAEEILAYEEKKAKNLIDFCDLNINDPSHSVELIFNLLSTFTEDRWVKYHEIEPNKRSVLTSYHAEINQLYRDLKNHFYLTDETPLTFLGVLEEQLTAVLAIRDSLDQFNDEALSLFGKANNYSAYNAIVLESHWVRFKEQFPSLSSFEIGSLGNRIEEIIESQDREAGQLSESIKLSIQERFNRYHTLLATPARKLTEEQKALKSQLKKGKSILIKEFAKTRRHPSIRSLYSSEANVWIDALFPVWLTTPFQLANCFEMKQELFDVLIFDEASQIPLQNSLGAIYRSTQFIVAGDEHQMGPTTYFQSTSTEVVDLLHQANYYLPKVTLLHHYRSSNADLIAFSNNHFYEGKLQAFSAYGTTDSLVHHYINDGQFVKRRNQKEARKVAELVAQKIDRGVESIGIVAFSEEQLSCIYENLPTESKSKLEERWEKGTGFFKALENVQGDECDELIISLGYGKNEEGEFHLRMGPMNQSSGRNRLNVLLTRAKESIDFICSVHSSEFKLSENESINLLRQWIVFSESSATHSIDQFPFGLSPEIHENQLHFKGIDQKISSAQNLISLHRVLSRRGWEIHYS